MLFEWLRFALYLSIGTDRPLSGASGEECGRESRF